MQIKLWFMDPIEPLEFPMEVAMRQAIPSDPQPSRTEQREDQENGYKVAGCLHLSK
jgi:hypothetical protein